MRKCFPLLPSFLLAFSSGCDTQEMKTKDPASEAVTSSMKGLDVEMGEVKRGKAAWRVIEERSGRDVWSEPKTKASDGLTGSTYVDLLENTETANNFSVSASKTSQVVGRLT